MKPRSGLPRRPTHTSDCSPQPDPIRFALEPSGGSPAPDESQQLWIPSREAYIQARAGYAELPLEEFGTGMKLGSLVAQRLARAPFDRMRNERAEPGLPIPLVRSWEHSISSSLHPIEAEGIPPTAKASLVFLRRGTRFAQSIRTMAGNLEHAAGSAAGLGRLPCGPDHRGDGDPNRGLEPRQGDDRLAVRPWHTRERPARRESIRSRGDSRGQNGDTASRFHGLRIVGGRIFTMVGERRLLAFDGDTGLIDWSYAPDPGDSINPHLWIGPGRSSSNSASRARSWCSETANGRRRATYPKLGDEDWERDPLPIDEEHLGRDRCSYRGHVRLEAGASSWVFRESQELPRYALLGSLATPSACWSFKTASG